MSSPYPIRSPLNPNGGSNKDYSYTSPLSASGSDYPCKGYANDPFVSVASYTAGGSYEIELEGSATHGGGSCQISLSYDTAKTFKVIKSIEGGCPLTPKYSFTIPSDAPSGKALLVWTWFNKVGNREMYMNCAQVTINGKSSKRSHPRHLSHKLTAREAFSSLPPIFLANINNPEGECTTVASEEVAFPLPGSDLQGSVPGPGFVCKGSAPFLSGSGSSSSSNSESSSGSSSSDTPPSSTSPSSPSSTGVSSSIYPSISPVSGDSSDNNANSTPPVTPASTPTAVLPSPAASSPSPTPPTSGTANSPTSNGSAGSCTEGQIVCSSDGNSFSICSNGSLVPMGSVASGTTCKNGAIGKRDVDVAIWRSWYLLLLYLLIHSFLSFT